MTEKSVEWWRRHERALGAGVFLWAFAVSTAVTLRPEATAGWLVTTHPVAIAGMILLSIGLCGAFAESALVIAGQWLEPSENDLTDFPPEE
jgi:hypothetical protein